MYVCGAVHIHLLTMHTDTGGQFIQRQKVLALWRDIVRSINHIPDASTRSDMRRFARDEFQQHRNVSDLVSSLLHNHARAFHQQATNCIQGHIRYLLSVRRLPFHPHRVLAHVADLLPPDRQDPVPDYERLPYQLWRPHRMNIEHPVLSLLLALLVHVVARL
jgi:hypothetical protein